MKPWKTGKFLMAAALLMGAGLASAADKNSTNGLETDAAIANKIRHEIVMYPHYNIWDDVQIAVSNGTAHLTGAVTQPYKKDDMDRLARQVPGVSQLKDDLRVLPLSPMDDQLRLRIARAIYGDPALIQYANQPLKPIHIVVEDGHVTLNGVVDRELDKEIAGVRASSAMTFGKVINNLEVAPPQAHKS